MVRVLLVGWFCFFFFFKQKTAYEMRISDWSSDVCSSDLARVIEANGAGTTFLEAAAVEVQALLDQGTASLRDSEAAMDSAFVVTQIGRASCRERVCQYV